MKTSKLIWAALLFTGLASATFNGTSAQTNINAQGNQQVAGQATKLTSSQPETYGIPFLAAVDLDNNGHKSSAHKNTTKPPKPTSVTLNYTSGLPAGVGHLLYVEFYQGGVLKYTFQNYQINGATIPQGNYVIILHISNPLEITTYSTLCTATNWFGCANYFAATYMQPELAADLTTSTTLNFYSATYSCPSGGA